MKKSLQARVPYTRSPGVEHARRDWLQNNPKVYYARAHKTTGSSRDVGKPSHHPTAAGVACPSLHDLFFSFVYRHQQHRVCLRDNNHKWVKFWKIGFFEVMWGGANVPLGCHVAVLSSDYLLKPIFVYTSDIDLFTTSLISCCCCYQ